MYSPRLYKERDSYVLYIPTVHAFGSLSLTNTFWYRHTNMTFPPPGFLPVYFFQGHNLAKCKKAVIFNIYYFKDIFIHVKL